MDALKPAGTGSIYATGGLLARTGGTNSITDVMRGVDANASAAEVAKPGIAPGVVADGFEATITTTTTIAGTTTTGNAATAGGTLNSASPADFGKWLTAQDKNGNGQVGILELQAGLSKVDPKNFAEYMRKTLELDTDGNGAITTAEAAKGGVDLKAGQFERFMSSADKNKDARISMTEVMQHLQTIKDPNTYAEFGRKAMALDTNRNGVISQAEAAKGGIKLPNGRRLPRPMTQKEFLQATYKAYRKQADQLVKSLTALLSKYGGAMQTQQQYQNALRTPGYVRHPGGW